MNNKTYNEENIGNGRAISNQPRFRVLRVLGDINNKEASINDIELWKQDQYVHKLQFEKLKMEYPNIKQPDFKDYIPHDTRTFVQKIRKQDQKKYEDECEKELLAFEADNNEYNRIINKIDEDNKIIDIYRSVKKAHNYTCYFCGFKDRRYIEIHHLDGDHFNNDKNNLVTACTLCHRQHHLFWLSLSDQAVLGIQDNEFISQVELNIMQRIALVMEHHPNNEYRESMGVNGKLGELFSDLKNKFSRPIHASLMTNSAKKDLIKKYVEETPLVSPITNKSLSYNNIKEALMLLEKKNHDEHDAAMLKEYDDFINTASKKDGVDIDEFRQNNKSTVIYEVNNYEKKIQKSINDNFTEDTHFSIFELAMALKDIPFDAYQNFNPKSLFLLFNSNIFTKEQIEYYLGLPEFNPSNWGEES